MGLKRLQITFLLIFLFGCFFTSCSPEKYKKKKIVYINSYHRGHPSSDEIMDAVVGSFPTDSFNVSSFLMDTKRNTSQAYIENKSNQLYDSIIKINPDILIVSDDNAVKYIVQPKLDKLSMPIIFCGVNGDDREYGLPANRVTGMLEILPVDETIMALRPYFPSMRKLLVLTENTTTSKKEKVLLDTMFVRVGVSAAYELVDDFETWKSKFIEANEIYDIIYVVTHGAIKEWNHEEAVHFVEQHIKIPVITCEDFIMPYVVFGMTKVAKEQGLWAAETAKKILNGHSLDEFPVTKNHLHTTWLNTHLAEKINFYPDTVLLNKLNIVGQ